jgi:hypothetical protein
MDTSHNRNKKENSPGFGIRVRVLSTKNSLPRIFLTTESLSNTQGNLIKNAFQPVYGYDTPVNEMLDLLDIYK